MNNVILLSIVLLFAGCASSPDPIKRTTYVIPLGNGGYDYVPMPPKTNSIYRHHD
jgi:starvation-inducible outer membrane lipoprotein